MKLPDGINREEFRARVKRALEAEFPELAFKVKDVAIDSIERTKVTLHCDSRQRIEDIARFDNVLGTTLGVDRRYEFVAYQDDASGKPFVLRDKRDKQLHRTTENFVVEHFKKGVP